MTNDSEQAIIGTLISSPGLIDVARKRLKTEHFTDGSCATIYGGMLELGTFDMVTMFAWLRKGNHGDLIKVLTDVSSCGVPTMLDEYITLVVDDYKRRRLVETSAKITELAKSKGSVKEIIRHAEGEYISLYDTDETCMKPIKDDLVDYVSRLNKLKGQGFEISGLTTGFPFLDKVTDGLRNSELIIIGARPSMGKTSLAMSISTHVAVSLKKRVAIFSIESPTIEIINKIISQTAEISTQKLRTGKINDFELTKILEAIDILADADIWINDLSTIDIYTIRYLLKQMVRDGKRPDLIVLDYLQIVQTEKGFDNFAKRMGNVAQQLKNIAKELNVPFLVIAQVNRNNEQNAPRVMDLKDSGDIEQIADIIMLLHRDEWYLKDKCPEPKRGILDVDVAKNRNGSTNNVALGWIGDCTKPINRMF
jgi:replicative DNA helicase